MQNIFKFVIHKRFIVELSSFKNDLKRYEINHTEINLTLSEKQEDVDKFTKQCNQNLNKSKNPANF